MEYTTVCCLKHDIAKLIIGMDLSSYCFLSWLVLSIIIVLRLVVCIVDMLLSL